MPALLLVRHGQASFGEEDYDVLSDLGREQAALLAADLVRREVRVDRLISGAMARQRDTAAALADALGLEVAVDPRLDEYDADDVLRAHSPTAAQLSGVTLSTREFQDVLQDALRAWIEAGDGGRAREPWPAFRGRVTGAVRDAAQSLGSGEAAALCTSGGVIGAVCAALIGAPDTTLVPFNNVTVNAGLSTVVTGRGGMTLVSFNEHQHLPRRAVTYR